MQLSSNVQIACGGVGDKPLGVLISDPGQSSSSPEMIRAFRTPHFPAMSRSTLSSFVLNVIGNVTPILVAVVALPVITHFAGTERLGFLGLAWTLIGYLGLLDLGLSRVVMRRVAQAGTAGQLAVERDTVWRIGLVLCGFSAAVVAVIAAVAPLHWFTGRSIAPSLVQEASTALLIVLATLPFSIVTGVLRGVLDGRQWFGISNALKVVFGSLTYLAPMLVAIWVPTLPALVGAIAVARILALAAHVAMAARALPAMAGVGRGVVRFGELFSEGGWLTVTGVVSPLMVSFDRFAVASLVSLSAAAYYIVPQDMVLRLLVLPVALAGTVFPMMARAHGAGDSGRHHDLGRHSFYAALALSLPMCIALAVLAQPLLRIWMGADFARESTNVAAVFAIGLLTNCVAQVPYSSIQAAGRADLTGKLHLAEFPLYMAVMFAMTLHWGLLGAAAAWTLRTTADCFALLWIAHRGGFMRDTRREASVLALAVTQTVLAALLPAFASGALRVLLGGVLVVLAMAAMWRWGRASVLWSVR